MRDRYGYIVDDALWKALQSFTDIWFICGPCEDLFPGIKWQLVVLLSGLSSAERLWVGWRLFTLGRHFGWWAQYRVRKTLCKLDTDRVRLSDALNLQKVCHACVLGRFILCICLLDEQKTILEGGKSKQLIFVYYDGDDLHSIALYIQLCEGA